MFLSWKISNITIVLILNFRWWTRRPHLCSKGVRESMPVWGRSSGLLPKKGQHFDILEKKSWRSWRRISNVVFFTPYDYFPIISLMPMMGSKKQFMCSGTSTTRCLTPSTQLMAKWQGPVQKVSQDTIHNLKNCSTTFSGEMIKSKLPNNVLGKIWKLSDVDRYCWIYKIWKYHIYLVQIRIVNV